VRLGSDTLGVALGLLTIPMAVFSMASVPAGLMLALWQDWPALLFGVAAFLGCSVLARLLERLVIAIDDAAAVTFSHHRRRRAYAIAIVSGALPVLVIFVAEIVSFRGVFAWPSSAPGLAQWLWGYGVATVPWSLFAEQVSRFRRTLVGIRVYAGHIALWLFLILTHWLNASPVLIVAALLVPATLPFTLGMVLALADREAIANVRV
jgi:hypothetical protein